MRMVGTEKSFRKWLDSQNVEIADYPYAIRERQNVYSIIVPELKLHWRGYAQDANEARILAVENYERKKNPVKKKRAKKKVTRRKNPHSLYWTIFAYNGKIVQWFRITEHGKLFATSYKNKSVLFKSKSEASKVADGIRQKGSWHIGITNYSTTAAQIKTALAVKP